MHCLLKKLRQQLQGMATSTRDAQPDEPADADTQLAPYSTQAAQREFEMLQAAHKAKQLQHKLDGLL